MVSAGPPGPLRSLADFSRLQQAWHAVGEATVLSRRQGSADDGTGGLMADGSERLRIGGLEVSRASARDELAKYLSGRGNYAYPAGKNAKSSVDEDHIALGADAAERANG